MYRSLVFPRVWDAGTAIKSRARVTNMCVYECLWGVAMAMELICVYECSWGVAMAMELYPEDRASHAGRTPPGGLAPKGLQRSRNPKNINLTIGP